MSQLPGFNPNEYFQQQQPQVQQQPQAPARWSKTLASNPYGAYGEMRKSWFDDESSDPNARVQQELSQYRQQWGQDAPADDASLMQLIASGQAPTPKNATPAQQWNAQPAQTGQNDLMQLLMQRINQPLAVDRNDPTIRAQVDPYRANIEQQRRNYVSDIAEQAGPYGNIRGEQRMAAERAGQQAGAFESEIIGREIGARRDEIEQALQLAVATGNQQAALQLQMQLAQMNDRARTLDRNQSADQFLRELALREYGLTNELDLRWAGL